MARYGHDTINDDERTQNGPWWNPYGTRKKSPEEMVDTMNKPYDISKDGPNGGASRSARDGEENDPSRGDNVDQLYGLVRRKTLTDQQRSGELGEVPTGRGAPLDSMMDSPMSQGYGTESSGFANPVHSPLGEHAQTMRKVEDGNPNKKIKDNQPGRLPGGVMIPQAKPFGQTRRSQVVSPLQEVWAWQVKKG